MARENNGVWVRHQEVVTDFRPYLFVNPDNFHQKDEKSNQFPRKLRSHQVKSAIREKYRDAVIDERDMKMHLVMFYGKWS